LSTKTIATTLNIINLYYQQQQILKPNLITMQAEKPRSSATAAAATDDDDFLEDQEQALVQELASIEQQKKRLKTTTADSSSSSAAATSITEGEKVADGIRFSLSNKRFLTVKKWKGKSLIDVREFYEKDNQVLPGKTGISLTVEQWDALKGLIGSVDAALNKV
jgi:hypothetical protein